MKNVLDGSKVEQFQLEKNEQQLLNSSIQSSYATKEIVSEFKVALNRYLHKSAIPSELDLKSIQERQLGHTVTNIFAVESERCVHGYPRAFMVKLKALLKFSTLKSLS